jgi:ABC-type ATPase involved in cell division
MATHDEKIVDKLKKRVIRIENGKVVSDKKGGKYRG